MAEEAADAVWVRYDPKSRRVIMVDGLNVSARVRAAFGPALTSTERSDPQRLETLHGLPVPAGGKETSSCAIRGCLCWHLRLDRLCLVGSPHRCPVPWPPRSTPTRRRWAARPSGGSDDDPIIHEASRKYTGGCQDILQWLSVEGEPKPLVHARGRVLERDGEQSGNEPGSSVDRRMSESGLEVTFSPVILADFLAADETQHKGRWAKTTAPAQPHPFAMP